MKAWLKGGLIGGGVGIILFLIKYLQCLYYVKISDLPFYCPVVNKVTIWLYIPFTGSLNRVIINYYMPLLSFLLTLLIYFIIGALIGLLINKFKSKNKN